MVAVSSESFNREIESDLVPVLETIGDGLLWRIDAHRHLVHPDGFNAGAEGGFGIPEDTQRDAVDLRNLSMAGQGQIDGMWNLRR